MFLMLVPLLHLLALVRLTQEVRFGEREQNFRESVTLLRGSNRELLEFHRQQPAALPTSR